MATSKRDFYVRYTNELNAGRAAIAVMVAKKNAIEIDIKSGRFSDDEIEKVLKPAVYKLKNEISNAKDETVRNCKKVCNAYVEELKAADAPDPAQINDDAKFLSMGVKLDPSMIKLIAARNSNNPTMTRLIASYVTQNGYNLRDVGIINHHTNDNQIANVGTAAYIAERVIAHADTPSMHMYERLVGAGSAMASTFNVNADGSAGDPID